MSIYIKFVRLFLVDCLFLQLSEIFSAKDRILMLLILRGIVIFFGRDRFFTFYIAPVLLRIYF